MTQMRTAKKKQLKLSGVVFVAFVVTFVVYLASSIFLKSYNVSLSMAKAKLENQIEQTKVSVLNLNLEIKELGDYDRVMGLLGENKMSPNNSNIYIIED